MNRYSTKRLCLENEKDWELFNKNDKNGSFFHSLKWKKIIEASFGYISHYFLVFDKNKVVAICPFFEITLQGFRGLSTLPNSDLSHIIIEEKHCNKDLVSTIFDETKKITKEKKLSFIIFNNQSLETQKLFNKFKPIQNSSATGDMLLDLKINNSKNIWHEVFSKIGKGKPRKFIKRFEKDNYKIKEVQNKKDLKDFYKYYKENLEYISAFPYPFYHFEQLYNTYKSNELRITLLHKNNESIGGLLSFIYPPKKEMYLRYLALKRDVPNKYHQTYYLYWDSILKAEEMKINTISFGSTINDQNDTRYRIKRQFGCNYRDNYSIIIPINPIFKFGYKMYNYFHK